MYGFIYWVKSLAIIRFIWWLVRNLWPVFVFLLFWPEIWDFLSQFQLCRDMAWRVTDVYWDMRGTMLYKEVADFCADAWDWMIGFITPGIRAVAGWITGLFGSEG